MRLRRAGYNAACTRAPNLPKHLPFSLLGSMTVGLTRRRSVPGAGLAACTREASENRHVQLHGTYLVVKEPAERPWWRPARRRVRFGQARAHSLRSAAAAARSHLLTRSGDCSIGALPRSR
eukprot:6200211-Pleurochrysis_carterae.AAC.3